MPAIRTYRVLLECSFADGPGSVFQTYTRHCLVDHPYDIRYRGTAVLSMRAFRERELYAKQAQPTELPEASTTPREVQVQESKPEREKTVFPAPKACEVRTLPPVIGGGCLEPVSQLAVLPDVPPLTLGYLSSNTLQLSL
ncbi:hypothetical protein BC835DRAFT_1519901 [Cytidiella melzeri]|nr:hypothetical protein BC835DRAFT_1519901 [Cytidiella melzeri]